MKHLATQSKVVASKVADPKDAPRSVKVGCGLECHWRSGTLRARVIAFMNDGTGLTGVIRRIFGRRG